jgi:hypothetical protein
MGKRPTKDSRLAELSKILLALPETKRKLCGRHAQFVIRKKTFAYFLDNHHGDGIVAGGSIPAQDFECSLSGVA